jgi:hypothetical protein
VRDGGEPQAPSDAGDIAQVSVNVGSMSVRVGDATLSAVMARAARRVLDRAHGVIVRWPDGAPSKAALDVQNIAGFYIEGTLTELEVKGTASQPTVTCKINMLLASYPDKNILGLLNGGASVSVQVGTPPDARAREDCVTAVIEDLVAKKILPTIASRTGRPEIASAASVLDDKATPPPRVEPDRSPPDTARSPTPTELAVRDNEDGKELMYQDKYAEAAKKFQQAAARVPSAKYFLNLCTARLQQGQLDVALTVCNAALNNEATPDQRARISKMIDVIKQEAQKQHIELHDQPAASSDRPDPDARSPTTIPPTENAPRPRP